MSSRCHPPAVASLERRSASIWCNCPRAQFEYEPLQPGHVAHSKHVANEGRFALE